MTMKKTIKNILTAAVTVLFSANLAFAANAQEVNVEIFNQKPEITRELETLTDLYMEQHEGVTIDITTIGFSDGAAGLQAKFTSGNPPTIMMLGGTAEIMRYENALADLSQASELVDIMIDDLLVGGNINDQLLALPVNVEGFGFMYNKEIFEAAGVDAESIETYNDFVTLVEELDAQKEELGIEAVFAYSGATDYITNQFTAHFTSPEYNHDIVEAYEAEELNWEYGDRFQMYADLINQYNVQPILSIDYSRSVEELFVNDQVAMVHQGNWIVPTLNDIDPDFVQNKLGLIPVFGPSDEEAKVPAGAPWYWAVNGEDEEAAVEAAIDFLTWVYTSEEGLQVLVEELNFVPPVEGYTVENITDPVSQTLYQALLDGESAGMTHKQYPNGWFQSSLHPQFQMYLDGAITWEEFEENTSTTFTEMREQDNRNVENE